ncbi:MAG: phage tail sheath subtilisin-like domain-containing protein [Deltaproteobacteria bacterium]|nr:phage tail sheath subtilisin-like domain-containing protein [Deltaproteobacteria bacterium]
MATINYANPGVYIEEKESGARPIEVAGTSTAAFLGLTTTGVANKPTPVESYKEYEEQFGGVSENGTDPGDLMALSTRAFFHNGGRNAYIVNVCNGGAKSKATLKAGRGGNAISLFDVEAKGIGKQGDNIEVVLEPKDGPGSGYFSMTVKVKGVTKDEYKSLPLAPGLEGSLEQVVNIRSKFVALKKPGSTLPNGASTADFVEEVKAYLEDYTFTSVKIGFTNDDIGSLRNSTEVALKISGISEVPGGALSLTNLDSAKIDESRKLFQTEIEKSLLDTPYKKVPVICKIVANGTSRQLKCILKTTEPNTVIEFINSPVNQVSSEDRSTLLSRLISGRNLSNPSDDLKTAVLSGEITQFDPTRLRNGVLNLRIGVEFGRTVKFDSDQINASTTLRRLAEIATEQLNKDELPIPRATLPTAEFVNDPTPSNQYCKVSFGPDAPQNALLVTDDLNENFFAPIEDASAWKITLPSPAPKSISFRLKPSSEDENIIGFSVSDESNLDLSKLFQAFNTQMELLSKKAQSQANRSAKVEAIDDCLLIWDPGNDVSVLTSVASEAANILHLTSSYGAVTKALNDIQETLAIIETLTGGVNGDEGGLTDYSDALQELERLTDVSIICLPGNPWDKGMSTRSWEIVEAAIAHAERQKDRLVIVDPPETKVGVEKWIKAYDVQNANLPTSSYSVVYYPWLEVPVGKSSNVKVPPCGFAAGIWSRTDLERGVWKAPAGVDARIYGAEELVHDLTDIQGGALNLQGVNCLRNLTGYGQVVWGGRTRATLTEPQWRYLPVRRTAAMIEDSLRDALLWAVHQPNKQDLWSALKLNIEAFMNRLFRAGAFQPQAARDAYFVKCGLGITMTQADIDAGVVRVQVGFAPVKPAEFVVITIEQINENR